VQTEMVEGWNSSSIPPDAAYFADFVRTRLRRSGILNVGGFSNAVFNV